MTSFLGERRETGQKRRDSRRVSSCEGRDLAIAIENASLLPLLIGGIREERRGSVSLLSGNSSLFFSTLLFESEKERGLSLSEVAVRWIIECSFFCSSCSLFSFPLVPLSLLRYGRGAHTEVNERTFLLFSYPKDPSLFPSEPGLDRDL